MFNAPLYNALTKYKNENKTRLHMPGHGGKCGELPLSIAYDVTELKDTDNLFDASGVILKSEQLAAKAFKSMHTLFSAGGATLCVSTAISHVAGIDGKIIAQRGCHKSVLNAAILLGLDCIWLYDTNNLEAIFSRNKDIKAVVITSPLYTGEISDIDKISRVCKKNNCKLIVDNSHGTHLAFYNKGCLHPLTQGADYVIDSAHKTLPVLTGGAFLHTMHDDYYALKEKMSLFSSTSPSYLIMASLDLARGLLQKKGDNLLNTLLDNINYIKDYIESHSIIKFNSKHFDPFRVTINFNNTNLRAEDVFKKLYKKGISCEGVINNSIVAIPSLYTEKSELLTFAKELCNIIKNAKPCNNETNIKFIPPITAMPLRAAFFSEYEEISIKKSENRINARPVIPALPGVPVLMCGEIITIEHINLFQDKYKTIKVIKEESS